MLRFFRVGIIERFEAGAFGDRLRRVMVAAPVVAGVGGKPGQQLRIGKVELAFLQGGFGASELGVVIIFQRARDRRCQIEPALQRNVVLLQCQIVFLRPDRMLLRRNGIRPQIARREDHYRAKQNCPRNAGNKLAGWTIRGNLRHLILFHIVRHVQAAGRFSASASRLRSNDRACPSRPIRPASRSC